jgi:hypothetical protein
VLQAATAAAMAVSVRGIHACYLLNPPLLGCCRVSSIALLATDSQTKEAQAAQLRGQIQFNEPGLVVVQTNADGTSDVSFTREQLQAYHSS